MFPVMVALRRQRVKYQFLTKLVLKVISRVLERLQQKEREKSWCDWDEFYVFGCKSGLNVMLKGGKTRQFNTTVEEKDGVCI